MRNLLLLFLVGLTTGFISDKLYVLTQPTATTADDLYIEGQTSGDLPVDDEDGADDGSGSGSGYWSPSSLDEEEMSRRANLSPFSKPPPSAVSTATTVTDSQDAARTTQDRSQEMLDTNPTSNGVFDMSSPDPSNVPLVETTTAEFSTDIAVTKYVNEDESLDTGNGVTPIEEVLLKAVEKDVFADRDSQFHDRGTHEEVTSENMWERTEVLAAVIACGVVGFLFAVFLLLLLAYRMKKKDEGSYDLGDTKLSATAYHKAPTKEFYA
ncbi:syndecan-2-A-like [Odontesthes bonariensis]|uniref:syndecan-2-A-like n=1 Tax=Odontesthes bonariensis TaxID=219752 RepID=UPI003F58DAC4